MGVQAVREGTDDAGAAAPQAGRRAATLPDRGGALPTPTLLHGLPPVVVPTTRLVVLGSFPGAASLAARQYYAHPRNGFWPLLSAIWGVDLVALAYDDRLAAMQARGVGLWDVLAACRRAGSLDRAIADAVPNDLSALARRAPGLCMLAHNGAASARFGAAAGRPGGVAVQVLPSTSPAHASWSFDRKLAAWRAAFEQAGVA